MHFEHNYNVGMIFTKKTWGENDFAVTGSLGCLLSGGC